MKTAFRTPTRGEQTKQADAWVAEPRGQGGRQAPVNPQEKVARLTLDLPDSLHHRFKMVCVSRKTTMLAEATRMIEEYTARAEKRKEATDGE